MEVTDPSATEVEIRRTLNIAQIEHMDEELASSEDGIGLNLHYFDVRGWSVSDAGIALEEESELLERLSGAGWTTDEASEIIEEHFSDYTDLSGFDVGMGSAVLALSAAGATPISSCNGGQIGTDHHSTDVPHILFAGSKTLRVEAIEAAIEGAGLGAIPNEGYGEIYADQVLKFHRFARLLFDQLG